MDETARGWSQQQVRAARATKSSKPSNPTEYRMASIEAQARGSATKMPEGRKRQQTSEKGKVTQAGFQAYSPEPEVRAYHRSRSPVLLERHREARDFASKRIPETRSKFYAGKLSGSEDSRALWKELKHLGLLASVPNDQGLFSPDQLNSYFSSVAQRPDPPAYNDFFFYFSDITPEALRRAISDFTSQSRGVDDLSLRNFKDSLPLLFPFILTLINLSLTLAVYPSQWKEARVLPLAKVKSPFSLEHYRPISNLCILSKVFERIVLNQIMVFLDSRGLLDLRQSGFLPALNTQSALLRLTEDIRKGIDNRKVTLFILFDFRKDFDSIPYSILLSKLYDMGFPRSALNWIANYLQGRSQAVAGSDGKSSSWQSLDQGVPQGSVLGPLLFLIFNDDLSSVLRFSNHLIYADDLQIYLQTPFCGLTDAICSINDIDAVTGWAAANALKLNVAKTQAIFLGSTSAIARLKRLKLTNICDITNIFPNFRASCFKTHDSDSLHYYTALGLAFDAMLKYTGVNLQLLDDTELILFIERAIRGDVAQCSNRHARANNRFIREDFDPNKAESYFMYFDVNNLYCAAMNVHLLIDSFEWEYEYVDITNHPDDLPIGYFLEVDLEYPIELHEDHRDLPLCPKRFTTSR
ncbi:uncharacterized protein LOC124295150 [Neodiprion lecontei]|uniref:Uncharacterized protein LOC124295150 n=1 Tax=Neodiprion lecontei TaxID=441921 RepID=A0ABM3GI97_NEOLC|nr:uncharacterized protein LOC124295150 [Neodiprion lecontei]